MTDNVVYALDLFCGGGGSGNGILEAFELQGKKVEGTFINHWDHAINTHVANHPEHRHLCTGVDDVSPSELYRPDQHLTFLWGSPECTHHSQARGGKPVNEQSRATAQCLVRWIRHKRPDTGIVENVPEFFKWGPCIQKRDKEGHLLWIVLVKKPGKKKLSPKEVVFDFAAQPEMRQQRGEDRRVWRKRMSAAGYEMSLTADKKKEGVHFRKWKRKIQKMGYHFDSRVIVSADNGDPTTRRRLYVGYARIESGMKVVWPNPTHSKPAKDGSIPKGLEPWVCARRILDLNDKGTSIFSRKKPLKKKSLFRIAHGVVENGLAEFIMPQQAGGRLTKSIDEPVSPVTTTGAEAVVSPRVSPLEGFILPSQTGLERARPTDRPVQTITTESRGIGLAQPDITPLPDFIVQQQGNSTAQSTDQPLTAVCASTTHHHVANPVLIKLRGTGTSISVDVPAPTITAGGGHEALATVEIKHFKRVLREQLFKAFCVAIDQHGGNSNYVRDLERPMSTLVTKNNQGVVTVTARRLEPSIVETAHGVDHNDEGRRVHDVDKPLGVIHASGTNFGVAQPELSGFIIPNFGENEGQEPRTHSLDAPAPTTTSHGAGGLVSAELIPLEAFGMDTAHVGADEQRVIDLLNPLKTICGNRSGLAVVRPFIARFYSSGGQISSDEDPVPTLTTKARMAHCLPVLEIEGEFFVLDIFFRMLTVRELARAQGFPDSYQFPGTKTNAIKAIGNAVSCKTARALTLAMTTQNPNVGEYIPVLEKAA